MIPQKSLFFCLFVLVSQLSFANEEIVKISIGITPGTLAKFQNWDKQVNCWDIKKLKKELINRPIAEILLLCKALHMGGLQFNFDIHPTKTYANSLLLTQQQKIHMQSQSIWKDQADPELFHISHPVLRSGEFHKGIYTIKNHPMTELVKQPEDIKNYKGVTVTSWHQDWNLLRQLTKQIVKAPTLNSIHHILHNKKADFTLGEFNRDLTIVLGDVSLYPISNIKVTIEQSRHFAVRKGMKQSKNIIAAINLGLSKMRKLGLVDEIYAHSGLNNSITTKWQTTSVTQFSN